MTQLTPETQQILIDMQSYQQQLQAIMIQRESLTMQNIEIESALGEMKKTTEEEVFKAVGPVLIKAKKTEVEKEFAEKKELIDVRLNSLKKQEDRLKDKIKEAQEKFQKAFTEKQPDAS